MKELKEFNPDINGIVEGYSPTCVSCRGAILVLSKMEAKYPEYTFYKANIQDESLREMFGDESSLPVIAVFKNGNRIFMECGSSAVSKLKLFLEEK